MSRFKRYMEMISTANFAAPNDVGTIRKIKRLPGGKFKYEHATPGTDIITTKNPDGSTAPHQKIKGANEKKDYTKEGIFFGQGKEGSDEVLNSVKQGLIGIQKRSIPTMTKGKKK